MVFRKLYILIVTMVLSSCIRTTPCDDYAEYFAENMTSKDIVVEYVMWKKSLSDVEGMISDEYFQIFVTDISISSKDVTDTTIGNFHIFEKSSIDGIIIRAQLNEPQRFKIHEYYEYTTSCSSMFPFIRRCSIYNLTDTMYVSQTGGFHRTWGEDGPLDYFVDLSCDFNNSKQTEVHWTYKLAVTDSLLSLMEKDTSMLSLFPEYYGNLDTRFKN